MSCFKVRSIKVVTVREVLQGYRVANERLLFASKLRSGTYIESNELNIRRLKGLNDVESEADETYHHK